MAAQPAQPVMPNAADDPFGAMNAMAQMRSVQRAPEMIIVNDGKPVENVGASGKGVGLAKMIVPAIVALGLGVAIGQMAKNGAHYNEGIRGAGDILTVVKISKKTINELDKTLDDLSKNNFKPTKELSAEVAKLAGKLEVKEEIVDGFFGSFDHGQNIASTTNAFVVVRAVFSHLANRNAQAQRNNRRDDHLGKANAFAAGADVFNRLAIVDDDHFRSALNRAHLRHRVHCTEWIVGSVWHRGLRRLRGHRRRLRSRRRRHMNARWWGDGCKRRRWSAHWSR